MPAYKPPRKEDQPFSIKMPPEVLERAKARAAAMHRWGHVGAPSAGRVSLCASFCSWGAALVRRIRRLISFLLGAVLI
eukprot:1808081-Prymnesium_polylepis.1